MKKQLVIIGITLGLLTVGLSGCTSTSNDTEKFAGTWKDSLGNSMTFNADGTYSTDLWIFGGSGSWDNKAGKIVFEHSGIGGTTITAYDYSFSNNDNGLEIKTSSGYIYQFTKQ